MTGGPAPSPMGPIGKVRQQARRLRRAVQGSWLDRRLGVETRRAAMLSGHVGDNHGYEAADVWRLPKILPRHEVAPSDVLVDVGAGKGRVLLFAARTYPFRRLIGVELVPELAAAARANIAARPAAERARMTVVEADAASWTVPDDATVFHLFNPFDGDTFRAFLAEVVESQRRRERVLRLLYTHGHLHDDVMRAGFRVVRERPRYTLYLRGPAIG